MNAHENKQNAEDLAAELLDELIAARNDGLNAIDIVRETVRALTVFGITPNHADFIEVIESMFDYFQDCMIGTL